MDAAASGGHTPAGRSVAAYGEVVWSWRRDRGVKRVVRPIQRRWQTTPLTGESTYKPSTHCAGKAGMSRLYLSNPCASLTTHCTRCCGRSQRPAFPAPSVRERDNEMQELGQIRVAGMRVRVFLTLPWRGRVDANEMSGGVG